MGVDGQTSRSEKAADLAGTHFWHRPGWPNIFGKCDHGGGEPERSQIGWRPGRAQSVRNHRSDVRKEQGPFQSEMGGRDGIAQRRGNWTAQPNPRKAVM